MKVILEGSTATNETLGGKKRTVPLDDLLTLMFEQMGVFGSSTGIVPPGVRLVKKKGGCTIWVYEVPPHVRRLKWITKDSLSPYGERAEYREVTLALPYTVLLGVFGNRPFTEKSECFFRTKPIMSLKDKLLYPALLNCSKFAVQQGNPLSWLCVQNFNHNNVRGATLDQKRFSCMRELLRCLFETGFNYSSENHEFSSWFSLSRKVDKRISTVEEWEKHSKKDPEFVLDVPWLETGKTLEDIVDRIFKNSGVFETVSADTFAIAVNLLDRKTKKANVSGD